MFLKDYTILFFTFLMGGTTLAVSSNSWITCWVGLEINLMSLIPLILNKSNYSSTESAIKYFVPQAMASLILILSSSMEALLYSPSLFMAPGTLITVALAIKLGMTPFHFWFPPVMKSTNWAICLIILVWQKIAPFILLAAFSQTNLFLTFILMSGVTGALGGLNQTNLKLIMAFSSIGHSGWILASLAASIQLWMIYYLFYSIILMPLVLTFNKMNLEKVNEISYMKSPNSLKYLLVFNILSLAGIPPFLGFSSKLFTIMNLIDKTPIFILIMLVMSSLMSLFYYSKMFFNSTLLKSFNKKMNLLTMKSNPPVTLILSSSSNLLSPLMVLLI